MTVPRVRIRIQRLVLHGVDPGDGTALACALSGELGRLLGAAGLPALLTTSGHHPYLLAPTAQVEQDAGPLVLGRQLAAAVERGLRR